MKFLSLEVVSKRRISIKVDSSAVYETFQSKDLKTTFEIGPDNLEALRFCAGIFTNLMLIWTAFLVQQRKRRLHRLSTEQQYERSCYKPFRQVNVSMGYSDSGCPSVEEISSCLPRTAWSRLSLHV